MQSYWIKKIKELKNENYILKEKLINMGISCNHFDGKECRHYENNNIDKDCQFCDNYEVKYV